MSSRLLNEYKSFAEKSLDEAYALPFGVYHDTEVHAQESEHVFRSDWIFACAPVSSVLRFFSTFDRSGTVIASAK